MDLLSSAKQAAETLPIVEDEIIDQPLLQEEFITPVEQVVPVKKHNLSVLPRDEERLAKRKRMRDRKRHFSLKVSTTQPSPEFRNRILSSAKTPYVDTSSALAELEAAANLSSITNTEDEEMIVFIEEEETKKEENFTPLVLMEEPQLPPLKLDNFITTSSALAAADSWFKHPERIPSPAPQKMSSAKASPLMIAKQLEQNNLLQEKYLSSTRAEKLKAPPPSPLPPDDKTMEQISKEQEVPVFLPKKEEFKRQEDVVLIPDDFSDTKVSSPTATAGVSAVSEEEEEEEESEENADNTSCCRDLPVWPSDDEDEEDQKQLESREWALHLVKLPDIRVPDQRRFSNKFGTLDPQLIRKPSFVESNQSKSPHGMLPFDTPNMTPDLVSNEPSLKESLMMLRQTSQELWEEEASTSNQQPSNSMEDYVKQMDDFGLEIMSRFVPVEPPLPVLDIPDVKTPEPTDEQQSAKDFNDKDSFIMTSMEAGSSIKRSSSRVQFRDDSDIESVLEVTSHKRHASLEPPRLPPIFLDIPQWRESAHTTFERIKEKIDTPNSPFPNRENTPEPAELIIEEDIFMGGAAELPIVLEFPPVAVVPHVEVEQIHEQQQQRQEQQPNSSHFLEVDNSPPLLSTQATLPTSMLPTTRSTSPFEMEAIETQQEYAAAVATIGVIELKKMVRFSDQVYATEMREMFGLAICVQMAENYTLVGTSKGQILMFDDEEKLDCILSTSANASAIWCLASFGKLVAAGHEDGGISVWDLIEKRLIEDIPAVTPPQETRFAIIMMRSKSEGTGHLFGSGIIHIGFVDAGNIVSGDFLGMVFHHRLSKKTFLSSTAAKTTRLLGRPPHAGRRKPTTIFGLGAVTGDSSHIAVAQGIVAILTPHKILLARTKPYLETLFRAMQPGDSVAKSGCLAWLPSGVGQGGVEEEDVEEFPDPVLAYAWDNKLFLLRVFSENHLMRPLDESGGELLFAHVGNWTGPAPLVKIEWFSPVVLLLYTAEQEVLVLDRYTMQVSQRADFCSAGFTWLGDLRYQEGLQRQGGSGNDVQLCFQHSACFKPNKRRFFLLTIDGLVEGALLNWSERLERLRKVGMLSAAVTLACDYLEENSVDMAALGLPVKAEQRKEILQPCLLELLKELLGVTSVADYYLAQLCVKATLLASLEGFLFSDIFGWFQQHDRTAQLMEALIPWLLVGKVSTLSLGMLQQVVVCLDRRPKTLERCLLRLAVIPPAAAPLLVPLLRKEGLWEALLRLWTEVMKDWEAPLLHLKPPLLFSYIKGILSSPPPKEATFIVLKWLNTKALALLPSWLSSFPSETVQLLDTLFDYYAKGQEQPVLFIQVLLDNPRPKGVCFLASTCKKHPSIVKLNNTQLQLLLGYLIETSSNEAEQALLDVCSVYGLEMLEERLSQIESSCYFQALEAYFRHVRAFDKVVETFLLDTSKRRKKVFDCVRKLLSHRPSVTSVQTIVERKQAKVRAAVWRWLPEFVEIDGKKTALMVRDLFYAQHDHALRQLPQTYLEFAYLKGLLDSTIPLPVLDYSLHARYVALLCEQRAFDDVCRYLKLRKGSYDVEAMLALCRAHQVVPAIVWLLEDLLEDRPAALDALITAIQQVYLFSGVGTEDQEAAAAGTNKDLFQWLDSAISICERSSLQAQNLVMGVEREKAENECCDMWFELLSLYLQLSSLPAFSCVTVPWFSELLDRLLQTFAATSSHCVSLPRLLLRVISSLPGCSKNDMKYVLIRALDLYRFDEQMLELGTRLVARDVNQSMCHLVRLRKRGWRSNSSDCTYCSSKLWISSSSSASCWTFHCGHAFHTSCYAILSPEDDSGNICPVCHSHSQNLTTVPSFLSRK